jgi:hypothetical protein
MKTTLFLDDETVQAKLLLLENPAPTEAPVHETEAVAGCNCDRWGHPCPGYGHSNGEQKGERPFSLPLDE